MSEHVYMEQTFYFKRARKILVFTICLLYWIESAYIKEISEPDINDNDEKIKHQRSLLMSLLS